MKQRILVVCDYYYPNATSIGVCTHKVAKALQKQENEVHILAFGDEKKNKQGKYEEIPYYCIKKRFHERCITFGNKTGGIAGKIICTFGKFKMRLWQILWFPFFRMDSLIVPLRYYKAISKLHKQNKYDMIVATCSPFDGMLGTYWFKKKHFDVIFCLYILDTLTHLGKTKFISEELNDKMGWRWEKKIFLLCDKIINLNYYKSHYEKERYYPFKNKMVYTDIPFIQMNNMPYGYFNSENVNFVYTGRILKHIASSSYATALFDKLNKNKQYILHYFSAGDEEDMIKEYERKSLGKIIAHGLVPHEQIPIIQKSADVLVSIGNSGSVAKIASKIFEYISTGNRIVHFQKEDNDTAIVHYQKYGNSIILDERESIEKNIEKLENFLSTPYVVVDYDRIKELFSENLPEFTAKLIMDCR
jgi:glycosyltransferase involved in cell wall biosynthesis